MHAHYEAADLALQAAVLAHGIAEGQPLIDGNKRTALIAMLTFLEINGVRIEATDSAPSVQRQVVQGLRSFAWASGREAALAAQSACDAGQPTPARPPGAKGGRRFHFRLGAREMSPESDGRRAPRPSGQVFRVGRSF
jgi:hypothetical protein